ALIPLVLVAGCKPGGTAKPAPKDAPSLLADVQAKVNAAGKPDSTAEYDVRQPDGIEGLKAALKPYDAALDEADGVLAFGQYGSELAPAAVLVETSSAMSPAHKAVGEYLVFLKNLAKLLVARARLRFASAKSEDAIRDFEAAARISKLTGQQPGSLLALLVHVGVQAIVTNAIHHVDQDTSPDAPELRKLASIAAGMEDAPDWAAIINAEVAAGKRMPEASSARGKKELSDFARSLAIVKSTASLAAIDQKFRAWVGEGSLPTNPQDLAKASAGLLVASCIEQELKGTANCRMTAAALEMLAANEEKKGLPSSLPTKYKTSDPFDLAGGQLRYGVTKEGFIISSPGGLKRFPATPNLVSFTYPQKTYLKVKL
ncbi:MAG TPA: hypothetical protein VKT78_03165, partial [Fimbriimonadaceae bacterium]|nr:hypothetical protein [Fimbriimonadaceae bacterium]